MGITEVFTVQPVERTKAKLRLSLSGVSHSGKTLSALKIAAGLGGKNIVVIDTEEPGCTVYQDQVSCPYQMIRFRPPFTAERYIEAIKCAEKAGADIIVIDSFSHSWAGTGGLLERQSAIADQSRSGNSYFAWREITPLHNKLVDTILQSPAHIIVCMRAKSQMEIMDVGGKKVPVKVGLEPIARKDVEYEFTLAFKLEHLTNLFSVDKDVTGLFKARSEVISEETGRELAAWLEQGKEPLNLLNVADRIEAVYALCNTLEDLNTKFIEETAIYGRQDFIIKLAKNRKNQLTLSHATKGAVTHDEPVQNS